MTQPPLSGDKDWQVSDFDYELPPELIAQSPLPERSGSRLLVVDRASGRLHHSSIRELAAWLDPGDVLVANNTRVLPARLSAHKAGTGGRVEILLLRKEDGRIWTALAKPARRLRVGTRLLVSGRAERAAPRLVIEVVALGRDGEITLRFISDGAVRLADYGAAPLPPYITTPLVNPDRYQTIYAAREGSAAAPTAGLHFSPELLVDLREHGIVWKEVTLHVGLDTFRPMTVERVSEHQIHREWCDVKDETARAVAEAKRGRHRVVAVGTTAARTLETLGASWDPGNPHGLTTMADIFIVPGYRWQIVDALLTNFHLPGSTLLMMVSALAGVETIRHAYAEAIAARYRFYSFGDAMLIR